MTCIRVTQSASGSAIGRLLAGALLVVGLPSGAAWVASPLTAPNYPLPSGERNGPDADRPGNPTAADTVEWRFSEPQPDWKPTLRAPGSMVAGLQRTNDALRVTLFEAGSRLSGIVAPDWTVNVGIPDVEGGVYIDLPDWRREGWAEVLVRARTTSTVTMMSIGLNPREGAVRADAPSMAATFQIRGAVTPIVRDGRVHTYRIHLDWGTERTGPWRRLGLSFSAPVSGSIDLLSVRVVPAAAEQPPNRVMETTLEPPQLRSDFALLRRALEEAHPAVYRHTAKRRMDAEFARAEATLTRPMTVLEFRNVLAPVIAAIKDGHTHFANYQGDEISAVLAAAKQFPLALTFQSRRAFVVLNHGLDGRVKPGMEVLAINGRSFVDILQRILPNLPRDGDVEGGMLYQLGISGGFFQVWPPGRTGFGEAYRLYVEDPPSFRTSLRDPHTHQTIAVDLPGVTVAEAAVNGEQNPVNREVLAGLRSIRALNNTARQSIRYLEGEHAAILIPAYGDDFPDFLREAFAGLSNRGTKHLIIDMRGNGGGYDVFPVLLFSYLTSKEFRPIEGNRVSTFQPSFREYTTFEVADLATDIYYGPASGLWKPDPRGGWLMTEKYPSIGLRQPAENHFDGPVYVLIDGGCFSACSAFTVLADYYQRATFVGEETGGVGGGGAGTDVGPTLPESHLHVGIPMESYFFLVEMRNPRRGTLPTHVVRQTVEDLAQGRDTALEFTLELIRTGKWR